MLHELSDLLQEAKDRRKAESESGGDSIDSLIQIVEKLIELADDQYTRDFEAGEFNES
jgi:hypothetical protein